MSAHGLIAGTLAAAMILAWMIVLAGPDTEPAKIGWDWYLGAQVFLAAIFTVLFFGWTLQ